MRGDCEGFCGRKGVLLKTVYDGEGSIKKVCKNSYRVLDKQHNVWVYKEACIDHYLRNGWKVR
jgi:hypothetical protein